MGGRVAGAWERSRATLRSGERGMSVVDRSTQPSAVAGYRRLHLVERAAPPAGGITRALQVVLVLAGVVLLIAGAAAFVGVVQQGALDAPAPLALGRARSAMAPSTGWLA